MSAVSRVREKARAFRWAEVWLRTLGRRRESVRRVRRARRCLEGCRYRSPPFPSGKFLSERGGCATASAGIQRFQTNAAVQLPLSSCQGTREVYWNRSGLRVLGKSLCVCVCPQTGTTLLFPVSTQKPGNSLGFREILTLNIFNTVLQIKKPLSYKGLAKRERHFCFWNVNNLGLCKRWVPELALSFPATWSPHSQRGIPRFALFPGVIHKAAAARFYFYFTRLFLLL